MPDALKNPILSDVLSVLHANGIRYVDLHRLIDTIYRYHQLGVDEISSSSRVMIVLPINGIQLVMSRFGTILIALIYAPLDLYT